MKIISKEIKEAVPEAYLPFSAYVIQTRALPDARDFLKSGGRYILWSQYFNKNTYDKNRKKGADIVGGVMHWNPHGDSGIWGNIVRFAKPFSMRYPLEDPKGNVGTMTAGDDYAAPRYLELRSSELAAEFTKLIKKDTIDKWNINFTGEDKYPSVFPTLFPNFVNGNTGIGVGCVSSIPSFNLKEAINSLKILVKNPDADYDKIYIAPDFPTGATIINANEVKESLRTGRGKAVKLRAVLEYNDKENAIEVKEIPYQVFTNRIMGEIELAIEENRLSGIKSYYDGTDRSCGKYGTKIVIYLNKGVNVQRICRQLYKETSLQSSFTICQLMLENGEKPKEYGLKEIMLSYLNHAMSCLKKSYIYDYKKLQRAILINEGYLVAIANIDDFVAHIKNADDEKEVINIFKEKYGLLEEQSKAIIELKLRRLMKLESLKINKDLEKQRVELKALDNLINNKEAFEESFIKELDRIENKWGDNRRTKLLNLDFTSEEDDAEPIEEKELLIYYTNHNNIYTQESTTLMTTRRGRKGSKVKLGKNEVIVQTINDNNLSELLAFTNTGKMYSTYTSELPINAKINCSQLFELEDSEYITTLTTMERKEKAKYLTFVTKNGIIKKTKTSEYQKKRGKSLKAINLKDDDEVLNVYPMNNEKIGFLTSDGNCIIIETENISPIGRAAAGVKGIKLNDGAQVIDSQIIENQDKFLIAVSKRGYIKKMNLSDIGIATRGTKGKKIQKLDDDDMTVKMLTINTDCDIIINTKGRVIKINSSEISLLSRDAAGTKSMNLEENEQIQDMLIS
nr:MAG: DNA gyrase/topoisomerase IV, subunit A [Bacteriophage sp.]